MVVDDDSDLVPDTLRDLPVSQVSKDWRRTEGKTFDICISVR